MILSCPRYLHTDVSDGQDGSRHQQEVTDGQLVTMSLVPGTLDSDVASECHLCCPPPLPTEKVSTVDSNWELAPFFLLKKPPGRVFLKKNLAGFFKKNQIFFFSKYLVIPLIRKIRTLLYNAGQTSWDTLLIPQQISLILGNPPELLPKKLHKAWTKATLKEILTYISSLETLLYTSNTTTVLSPPHFTRHQPLPHDTHQ